MPLARLRTGVRDSLVQAFCAIVAACGLFTSSAAADIPPQAYGYKLYLAKADGLDIPGTARRLNLTKHTLVTRVDHTASPSGSNGLHISIAAHDRKSSEFANTEVSGHSFLDIMTLSPGQDIVEVEIAIDAPTKLDIAAYADALRFTIGLAHELSAQVVSDEERREKLDTASFAALLTTGHAEIGQPYLPGAGGAGAHVTTKRQERTLRSEGMRKLGLPDLIVEPILAGPGGVSSEAIDSVANALIAGRLPSERGELELPKSKTADRDMAKPVRVYLSPMTKEPKPHLRLSFGPPDSVTPLEDQARARLALSPVQFPTLDGPANERLLVEIARLQARFPDTAANLQNLATKGSHVLVRRSLRELQLENDPLPDAVDWWRVDSWDKPDEVRVTPWASSSPCKEPPRPKAGLKHRFFGFVLGILIDNLEDGKIDEGDIVELAVITQDGKVDGCKVVTLAQGLLAEQKARAIVDAASHPGAKKKDGQ